MITVKCVQISVFYIVFVFEMDSGSQWPPIANFHFTFIADFHQDQIAMVKLNLYNQEHCKKVDSVIPLPWHLNKCIQPKSVLFQKSFLVLT